MSHRTCPICLRCNNNDGSTTTHEPPPPAGSSSTTTTGTAAAPSSHDDHPDEEPLRWVQGPCGHTFCLACLERLLLAPRPVSGSGTDAAGAAPTLGHCPLCRSELYLFDLVDCDTLQGVFASQSTASCTDVADWTTTPLVGGIFVESTDAYPGEIGKGSYHFPLVDTAATTKSPNDETNDDNDDADHSTPVHSSAPYYYVSSSADGKGGKLPLSDLHWHAATRTLAAKLQFRTIGHGGNDDGDNDDAVQFARACGIFYDHFHIIFSFAADWRFVGQGVVIKRRNRRLQYPTGSTETMPHQQQPETNHHDEDDSTNAATKATTSYNWPYPFDGEWRISESNVAGWDVDTRVTLQAFQITKTTTTSSADNAALGVIGPPTLAQRRGDQTYQPQLTLVATAGFLRVSSMEHLLADTTVPLSQELAVGSTLTWTATAARFPLVGSKKMTWVRTAVSTTVPPDERYAVGGATGRRMLRVRADQNPTDPLWRSLPVRTRPRYHRHGLWGNVFCQARRVGLASYHFEEDGGGENNDGGLAPRAYISYEHPSTAQWPPLDNGQVVPSRVAFHNVSVEDRTFRGEIRWMQDYGTSWQGMVRWDYEMRFDRDFTCIVSGTVQMYAAHTPDASQEMSRFGDHLIYCNAALWDAFREDLGNQQGEPEQEETENGDGDGATQNSINLDDYRRASVELRQRLQREGATVRTIAMVHNILTSAQDPQGINPIDCNL